MPHAQDNGIEAEGLVREFEKDHGRSTEST